MEEKVRKTIYVVLLIIFLPVAVYLLAIRAFLQFFIFAGVMSLLIRILKNQTSKKN